MNTGYGLLAVWPIVDDDVTRDALIAAAGRPHEMETLLHPVPAPEVEVAA